MAAFKDNRFDDRLATAANARKAALEKFKALPGPDDPAVIARQAARAEIIRAREIRIAERTAAKEADTIRLRALEAERQIEQAKLDEEQKLRDIEKAARDEAAKAAAKAARDAKYAARKARR